MSLYSGGLIIGRIFASEIWEANYFRKGFFVGGGGGGGGYYWNFTVFYILNYHGMNPSPATGTSSNG